MSEKRFGIKDGSNIPVFSIYTEYGKELSSLQLLEILNQLNDENEQLRQSHNKSECFYCKHCFRDDNYGVCCENRNSEHFTPHWDLHWENINDCEYFERIGCDDV